jgi:hypothetical protein
MHAPLDGKLLILLAHPDDEIFILPFLSKVKVKTFFVYLTNNSRWFSAVSGSIASMLALFFMLFKRKYWKFLKR